MRGRGSLEIYPVLLFLVNKTEDQRKTTGEQGWAMWLELCQKSETPLSVWGGDR